MKNPAERDLQEQSGCFLTFAFDVSVVQKFDHSATVTDTKSDTGFLVNVGRLFPYGPLTHRTNKIMFKST